MIVVTLDGDVIAPSDPALYADDAVVTRGDGVFETLLVRGGWPCLLSAHFDRLTQSAVITGLPELDLTRWRAAIAVALAGWKGGDDAIMRFVYGRGRGQAGLPTAFVTVSGVPDRVTAARRDGLSVITLDRGGGADDSVGGGADDSVGGGADDSVGGGADDSVGGGRSLTGVKSLSYALNSAALRHAERSGADDVIFVSSDGFVLEGPRSSVVIAPEAGILATPPPSMPILPGTTQRAVFDAAPGRGWDCAYAPLTIADLKAAQGVWLLSSVTLAARVHTIDGVALKPTSMAEEFADLVDEAMAVEL